MGARTDNEGLDHIEKTEEQLSIRSGHAVADIGAAGKWIGIVERVIVFILVLHDQYSAMGLLITAKGIRRAGRFGDQPLAWAGA